MYTLPTLPCALPSCIIPEFLDLAALTAHFMKVLDRLSKDDFTPDAIWRDSFALTGTLRTFFSAESIMEAFTNTSKTHHPSSFKTSGKPQITKAPNGAAWVNFGFTFLTSGTPATMCSGFLSVVPIEDGGWKIWIMRTILEGLKGQPSVDVCTPNFQSSGVVSLKSANGTDGGNSNGISLEHANDHPNGAARPNRSAVDTNSESSSNGTRTGAVLPKVIQEDFSCVIVGGGQAGLAVGGRLGALGVSYVILEKFDEVGDNWKTRYDSTKLHTLREFAHLPFDRTFPEESYPEYLTKDMLAAGYKKWARTYGINILCSTELVSGSWDTEREMWELRVLRHRHEQSLRCSYVVFATGAGSSVPVSPTYENQGAFGGLILHSGAYKSASSWKGKHGVVVGSANTAHDVADDMLAAGMASVTMVQRSPTFVIPAEHYKSTQDKIYNGNISTDAADRMYFSNPSALGRIMSKYALQSQAAQEPERFDALEKAGFLLDRDGDIIHQIFERFGGHYMDVGTSAKIASGQIKMKSDSLPVSWSEDGLVCSNGDKLRADVVVFATGFIGNLRLLVAELFGHELAGQLEDLWGLDEEGELKGAFKPCGHPAFWYHAGAVGQARYFSRFIALQIKAKTLGTPLPVYDGTRRTEKIIT